MEDFFIFNLYQPAGLKMISDHETFRSHVTTNECLTLLLGQAATPWTPNNHNVLIMEGWGGGGETEMPTNTPEEWGVDLQYQQHISVLSDGGHGTLMITDHCQPNLQLCKKASFSSFCFALTA